MEKEILKVATVEIENKDLLGDIAIQALNIQREGGIVDVYFIEGSDALRVKYLPSDNNLEDVLASWGKVLYTEKEVLLDLNPDDVKGSVRNDIDEAFSEIGNEGYTGDLTFRFEE